MSIRPQGAEAVECMITAGICKLRESREVNEALEEKAATPLYQRH